MPINFNGEVTINGNVEMYDNGSMKITNNEIKINISDLPMFIEENLKYSPNKEEYIKAAETLNNSREQGVIEKAFATIRGISHELGKNILIMGLSDFVKEIFKNIKKIN